MKNFEAHLTEETTATIYCDLDGVLVDLIGGLSALYNIPDLNDPTFDVHLKRIKDDLKQHQLRMKGNNYFSKDIRNQVMYCLHCMYMLPKCAVCLFPITVYNGYAEELKKNSLVSGNSVKNCGENLSNSIVWCPKCFHGGHYSHIMRWMQRG